MFTQHEQAAKIFNTSFLIMQTSRVVCQWELTVLAAWSSSSHGAQTVISINLIYTCGSIRTGRRLTFIYVWDWGGRHNRVWVCEQETVKTAIDLSFYCKLWHDMHLSERNHQKRRKNVGQVLLVYHSSIGLDSYLYASLK